MLKDHFSPALIPYVKKELKCIHDLSHEAIALSASGNHYQARKVGYDIVKSLEQIMLYAEEKQYHNTALHYLNAINEEESRRAKLAWHIR